MGEVLIQTAKEEQDFDLMRSFAPGEREVIAKCFERAWKTRHDKKQ